MSKFFYTTSGKELNPEFFGDFFQENFHKNNSQLAYFNDGRLLESFTKHIAENKNIILLGNALAGKTRLIYEGLKQTQQPLIIAKPNFSQAPLAEVKKLPENGILVLDNILTILNHGIVVTSLDDLRKSLGELQDKKLQFIISCRSGTDYELVFQIGHIREDFWQKLTAKTLVIPEHNAAHSQDFVNYWSQKTGTNVKKSELGKTIGDYFLEVNKLKISLSNLKTTLKKLPPAKANTQITVNFIQSLLKAVYIASFSDLSQTANYAIPLDLTEDIAKNILTAEQAEKEKEKGKSASYTPFQTFFSNRQSDKKQELPFHEGWRFLSHPDGLPLLKLVDDKIMVDAGLFDEVYNLGKKDSQYQGLAIFKILRKFYNDQELTKKGFLPSLTGSSRALLASSLSNVLEAEELLGEADKLGLNVSDAGWLILLKKLPDVQACFKFINHLKQKFDQLDVSRGQHIIFRKINSLADLKNLIEFTKQEKIPSDLRHSHKLLFKVKDWSQQKEIIKILAEHDVELSTKHWIRLLKMSREYDRFKEVLAQAKAVNHQVPDNILTDSVSNFNRWRDIKDALSNLPGNLSVNDLNLTQEKITRLIENTPVWEEATEVLELAQSKKLSLMSSSAKHLIKIAPSEEEAFKIKELLVAQKSGLTKEIFGFLMLKSRQVSTVLRLFDEMLDKKIKPDIFTYNFLFQKLPSNLTFEYYRKLNDQGLIPNYNLFRIAIRRARRLKHGLYWLHEMTAWGFSASADMLDKIQELAPASEASQITTELKPFRESSLNIAAKGVAASSQKPSPKLHDRPVASEAKESKAVFIAYSHHHTDIKDRLIAYFEASGILTFFDNRNSKYKDSLDKFSRRSSHDKHLVCIISEEYFKSPFCMVELCRADRKMSYQKKIWPIFIDLKKLSTQKIKTILDYWEARKKELALRVNSAVTDSKQAKATAAKDSAFNMNVKNNLKTLRRELDLINMFQPSLKHALTTLQKAPIFSTTQESDIKELINKIKITRLNVYSKKNHHKRDFVKRA